MFLGVVKRGNHARAHIASRGESRRADGSNFRARLHGTFALLSLKERKNRIQSVGGGERGKGSK